MQRISCGLGYLGVDPPPPHISFSWEQTEGEEKLGGGGVGETEGDKIRGQIKTCLKEARMLAREKWRDWG